MFKILKRKITRAEAKRLVEEIKFTPNIVGYSLEEWLKAEHVIISENENGELAGACLNYDFHQDWSKIAALFVFNEFRGQGIGKSLFYKSVEDAESRGKNVYTISANPIVIKMMRDLDFFKFQSLIKFPSAYSNYRGALWLHSIKWLLNLYRIKEIIRKAVVYKSNRNFIYGFKLYSISKR